MKNLQRVFIFALLLTCNLVNAQVTVSLHSNGLVHYFSGANALKDAYTAAANGDTVYLPGGSFLPPSDFDKGIVIFGAGHYPDSTLTTSKTYINGTINLQENADNFQMEGVEVTENIVFVDNVSANQVTLKYCKVDGTFHVQGNLSNPSNNIAIIECVMMGDVTLSNATNVAVYNCIVQSHVVNSVGNIFYNNIFLYGGSFNNPVIAGQVVNNIFYNNIFLQTEWNNITHGSGSTFRYNLFALSNPGLGSPFVADNNYYGIALSLIFVNQSGNGFNYLHNYHLLVPQVYPGSDGVPIGIYGGAFPYKEGAVPSNPHIRQKNVSPTTDAQGKLNVNINVAAQDK